MNNQTLLRKLEQGIEKNHAIAKWNILDISEHLIAKASDEYSIKEEFQMGRFLFDRDISVPEFYAYAHPNSLLCSPPYGLPISQWYILMEKVQGTPVAHLNNEDLKVAKVLFHDEIKKVLELGIMPREANYGLNSLFDRENQKLTLLDFECWESRPRGELERWYKRIGKKLNPFYI